MPGPDREIGAKNQALSSAKLRTNNAGSVSVFRKKLEIHGHVVALHFMHYNFARVHKTLRITPAMAAGISDHVWSLEEIAMLADTAFVPTKRGPYKKRTV